MQELIDRNAVINALEKLCERVCEYNNFHRSIMCLSCPLGGAFDALENLPTVQQIETDCISRQALYEQTANWEKDAIDAFMEATSPEDRVKWAFILQERTAFKHDVADAPTVLLK